MALCEVGKVWQGWRDIQWTAGGHLLMIPRSCPLPLVKCGLVVVVIVIMVSIVMVWRRGVVVAMVMGAAGKHQRSYAGHQKCGNGFRFYHSAVSSVKNASVKMRGLRRTRKCCLMMVLVVIAMEIVGQLRVVEVVVNGSRLGGGFDDRCMAAR
jgi:hypothetical protein